MLPQSSDICLQKVNKNTLGERWPSDKANHTCEKYVYVSQGAKNSFGKVTSWPQLRSEFLVAHSYLIAMLILIGLALFLHPRCFCLAFIIQ